MSETAKDLGITAENAQTELQNAARDIYNEAIHDVLVVMASRIDGFNSQAKGIGPNAQPAARLATEHQATAGLIKALMKS